MRYKDLLAPLFIVATATFIWAEPSKEVKYPQPLTPPANVTRQAKPAAAAEDVTYTVADIGLDLAITPGKDLASTTFDVHVKAPAGYEFSEDPAQTTFQVTFAELPGKTLYTNRVEVVAPHRYRFTGAGLRHADSNGELLKLPQIADTTTCTVSTYLLDPKQSRYSRGANVMVVQSDSMQLTLR